MSRRWARLAERRAATLLGALRTPTARVLDAVDGFPLAPVPAPAPCDVVIDPSRPEPPDDHAARLQAVIAACAPDGLVAVVTCGGADAAARGVAPRGGAATRALLEAHGFTVGLVPFDVLGPCAPLRLALGPRRERVLAELDAHLAAPTVRAAVRLVEAHLVATLSPAETARVLVVGSRRGMPCLPSPDRRVFDAAMLPLLHDDAVMRWLAFVDAELLSTVAGVDGLLPALRAVDGAAAQALLRARGRWWAQDLEVQRLAEASAHRLAARAVAVLAGAPHGELAPTLEYDLVAAFNGAIGGWLAEELPPCRVR